jgi:two-component system, NtrC family, response regulator AtoC
MVILLVDDDQAIRETVSRFLQRLGHTVNTCEDGQAALQQLSGQPCHLILSDIRMPRLTGHKLLQRVKADPALKHIEVILFTGFGDVKSAVAAMRAGAYDYLLKPVNLEELSTIIERIGDYLVLKKEHKDLKQNFDAKLQEATSDIQQELADIRQAYARVVGVADVGIFSDVSQQVFNKASLMHQNRDVPVLIEGETGTGKEVLARVIHYGTGNVTTPFVGINCAALSPNLIETELFGYEKGAFTGGNPKGQIGKMELADTGSIFLDEIGEMPIEYQAKFLRVLQEKEFYRVGGIKTVKVDVRFVCATNKNIQQAIREGKFREDLYFRLNIGYIRIPPLRERREEIIPLAEMFLRQLSEQKTTQFRGISPAAARILEAHDWPGNIRELKNTIERIVVYWNNDEILPEHLDFLNQDVAHMSPAAGEAVSTSLVDAELPSDGLELENHILDLVRQALEKHQGNKSETARFLGISRYVLNTYIKRLAQADLD